MSLFSGLQDRPPAVGSSIHTAALGESNTRSAGSAALAGPKRNVCFPPPNPLFLGPRGPVWINVISRFEPWGNNFIFYKTLLTTGVKMLIIEKLEKYRKVWKRKLELPATPALKHSRC